MKRTPRIGETAEICLVVGSKHTITFSEPPLLNFAAVDGWWGNEFRSEGRY
jgi:hypothetical protein